MSNPKPSILLKCVTLSIAIISLAACQPYERTEGTDGLTITYYASSGKYDEQLGTDLTAMRAVQDPNFEELSTPGQAAVLLQNAQPKTAVRTTFDSPIIAVEIEEIEKLPSISEINSSLSFTTLPPFIFLPVSVQDQRFPKVTSFQLRLRHDSDTIDGLILTHLAPETELIKVHFNFLRFGDLLWTPATYTIKKGSPVTYLFGVPEEFRGELVDLPNLFSSF